MRFKLTILLLALNAALFGVIFYFDKVQSTQSLADESARLILNPEFVQNLERISIQSVHTEDPWTLERSGDQWLVSSPFQWKANPFAVQQLLFQLRRLSWESRFPVSELASSGQTLASYDLESPPIEIELDNGSQSHRLRLGAPTEIGNRLYIMSPDGDFVHVVPRGLLDSLQRDLEAFLDRRIFSLSLEETRGIQIQDRAASSVRVRLERDGSDWQFVSPIETAADPEKVLALIAEWQGMEVEGFEKDSEIPLAMDGNSIRLTLEGLVRRETLILTPASGDDSATSYLARREAYPAVFRVKGDNVRELRSVQEDLRERRILSNAGKDWSSLEIRFGRLGVTLQQLESGSWQVLYTDEEGQLQSMPAAAEAIADMEQLFATMEAERFVSDAPSEADLARFGLQEPQRRLRLRAGNQRTLELKIGGLAPDDERTLLYAKTDQSDSVFLVRPHVLASLSLDPFHYRERTVRNLRSSAVIESLRIIHRPSGLDVPLEPSEASGTEKTEVLAALRSFVRRSRVERFLGEAFSDPLVSGSDRTIEWPYLLEAEVTNPSSGDAGPKTVRTYLSERLGGTAQFMGDPESGLVGTLPIELIEILDSVLAEYPELPVQPPDQDSEGIEEESAEAEPEA